MAITTGNSTYSYVGDHLKTVGSMTGLPTKTVTITVPSMLDPTMIPVVVCNQLSDVGVGIIGAWLSNPTTSGTTLNIKLSNFSLVDTLAVDPVTFKVVVL